MNEILDLSDYPPSRCFDEFQGLFWCMKYQVLLVYSLQLLFSDEESLDNTVDANNAYCDVDESVQLMILKDLITEVSDENGIVSFTINE